MFAPDAGQQAMLRAAEELSKAHMQAYNDPSHDWYATRLEDTRKQPGLTRFCRLHVQRVRALALRIARSTEAEGAIDMLVVELAALFHDLHDSKYASKTADIWEDLHGRFFANQLAQGAISEERARLVARICENVSYSKEVKRIRGGMQTPWHDRCLELHCVQDADKLDAMGGKCFGHHMRNLELSGTARHRHHALCCFLRSKRASIIGTWKSRR